MRAAVARRKPDRQWDLDTGEAAAILDDAARALAARGWSAPRLAADLGISIDVAQRAVDAAERQRRR